MEPTTGTLRTIEIASPSARTETLQVLRALFFIGLSAALFIAIQRGVAPALVDEAADAKAFPFVRRFTDLAPADRRVVTALREGIGEAERKRAAQGAWPSVESLAADGIPPFAPDPLDRDAYDWSLRASKGVVNYVGAPRAGSARPSFIVIIAEPDGSGAAVATETPLDEVHHRLDSGMRVHVGVFLGAKLPAPATLIPSVNFDDGWVQVLVGSPRVLSR